jgi:hypothetical protein
LSNAIKYAPRKPIDVSLTRADGIARLAVRDHGEGIAPENLARIFHPFERAESKTHASGLGLGLHIARRIVEAHGGTIGVSVQPGAGTTFTVELPLEGPSASKGNGKEPVADDTSRVSEALEKGPAARSGEGIEGRGTSNRAPSSNSLSPQPRLHSRSTHVESGLSQDGSPKVKKANLKHQVSARAKAQARRSSTRRLGGHRGKL